MAGRTGFVLNAVGLHATTATGHAMGIIRTIINALGITRDIANDYDAYGKRWWTSKTIWANVIAFAALAVNYKYGSDVLADDQQALIVGGIMSIVNLILRLTTTQPVVMRESEIKTLKEEPLPDGNSIPGVTGRPDNGN